MKRIVLIALFAVLALSSLPALHAQEAASAPAVAPAVTTNLAIELGIAPAVPLADCAATQALNLPAVSFAAEGPLPNPNPCRFVCLCCARLGSGSGCCADCDACLAGN